MTGVHAGQAANRAQRLSSGFTLIELLAVVAIIALLIGMLMPGLSQAREQAKKTKTRAMMKAIGDGLDLFRSENEQDFHGYPPSAVAEDETESGQQSIYGAQWLVRYLMGKDLKGYIPPRTVPRDLFGAPGSGWEQEKWYDSDASNGLPLERVGPYVRPEGVKLRRPDQMSGGPPTGAPTVVTAESLKQPVILDAFDFPILYYRADPRQSDRATAKMARYKGTPPPSPYPGIYTFEDNTLWTGQGAGGAIVFHGWDFGAGATHKIENFGADPPVENDIGTNRETFLYYILDKNAYEATYDAKNPAKPRTAIPYRKDSFILLSPGKDGLYGTIDDVNNF
jgi:prepilin-type N-terminal cleavage/methylation domain-containing protein